MSASVLRLPRPAFLLAGLSLRTPRARYSYWKDFDDTRRRWELRAIRRVAQEFERERAIVRGSMQRAVLAEEAVVRAELAVNARQGAWRDLLVAIGREVALDFAPRVSRGLKAAWALQGKADLADLSDEDREWFVRVLGPDPSGEDRWTQIVANYLRTEGAKRARHITDSTREAIGVELSAGVIDGEGIALLAARLDRLYRQEITPKKSVTIARTEVISASNLGSRAGAIATGLNLDHEWMATSGPRTRRTHAAADGQVKPLAEPFIVGGFQLLFPGDSSLGAAIKERINCRCTETYTPAAAPAVPAKPPRKPSHPLGRLGKGQRSFEQAMKDAADHPNRGGYFAFDGGDVEGLAVRVRRVTIDGKVYTEFKFKLTQEAADRLKASKVGRQMTKGEFNILRQRLAAGELPKVDEAAPQSLTFYGSKTWRHDEDGLRLRMHVMESKSSAAYALNNQVQAFIEGEPTPEKLQELMKRLGVTRRNYPFAADIKAYTENAFVRLVQTGNKSLAESERKALLEMIEREWGITPADVVMKADALGRPELQFTASAWKKIADKADVSHFQHSLTGGASNSVDTLAAIFGGDQGGLLSSVVRYTEGIGQAGMSVSSDMQSGGADYVFTRQQSGRPRTQNGTVIIKRDILRRLDWFSYSEDTYGAQNAAEYAAVKSRRNLLNLRSGAQRGHSGSQETMFRGRIFWEDVDAVYLAPNLRESLLKALRDKGVTQLGGRPIEEFIKRGT